MTATGTPSAGPALRRLAIVAVLLIAGGLAAVPAAAQTPNDQEIERLREEERQRRARTRAAGAATERRPVEDAGDITFEDILDDPDNLDLNFRFAKAQIDSGNLTGAAATLERMLLINPELAEIRVYYGLVLFRLDSLEEAERVLEDAVKLPLGDAMRAEARP